MGPANELLVDAPSPENARERHRIKVLRQYAVLDTEPEEEFDDLAAMAAHVCGTPIALISLVDEARQWFKARVGQKTTETPRTHSFCAHALDQPNVLVVPDAKMDERFARNPLVTGAPNIRFYAGAPLITPLDATLGTLCVIDRKPKTLTETQEWVLQSLARKVMMRLEQRRLGHENRLSSGHLPRGIHDFKLDELRVLVCTNAHRCALWSRLVSFLSIAILNGQFSYAYVGGDLASSEPYPKEMDVILEAESSDGPRGYAAFGRFLGFGLGKILDLYSIRLNFWMTEPPAGLSDFQTFFSGASPLKSAFSGSTPDYGMARVDLRDPEINAQFRDALDPYHGYSV